jgi:hypothetical protein
VSDLFKTIKACQKYLKGNIDKNETPNSQVSIDDGVFPNNALGGKKQIFQQFSGIYADKVQFFNELYELICLPNTILFEDSLNKSIDNNKFQNLEQIYQIIQENPNLSANRILAFMQGLDLIIDTSLIKHYSSWLIELLDSREDKNKIDDNFRRVFTDCVKWSFTYLLPHIKKLAPDKIQIWYKSVTPSTSQEWFMKLSLSLGFQIIYFDITKIHPSNWLPLVELSNESDPQPLPNKKVEIIETVAREASTEFKEMLNQTTGSGCTQSLFFSPFEYKEAQVCTIPLRTTYDEIKIIGTTEAYLRIGFKVEPGKITIPVLFAKVNGVLNNESDYWSQLDALHATEFHHNEELIPSRTEISRDYALYHSYIESDQFDPKWMVERKEWPYHQLTTGAQLTLAKSIIDTVRVLKVEVKPNEKREVVQSQVYSTLLKLPDYMIKLFHQFDYPKGIPKLLWFDQPDVSMSREDAAQILLLNSIGFDCLIYSPNGINSIENYLSGTNIDIFWLDQMKEYSLANKKIKRGLLQKLFGE